MTSLRSAALVLLLALPLAAAETPARPAASPGWDKLKSLVGDWTATVDGKPIALSYKLVSNGTALMETMDASEHVQMITMYHPDGDALLMTHYCAMGNQPRMRARGMAYGKIDFQYVDASNLKGPDEPRMARLVLAFPDPDHVDAQWTYKTGANDKVETFRYARRK